MFILILNPNVFFYNKNRNSSNYFNIKFFFSIKIKICKKFSYFSENFIIFKIEIKINLVYLIKIVFL